MSKNIEHNDNLPYSDRELSNYTVDQDFNIPNVPETKSIAEIIRSEDSFLDKAKATIRDTWLGRNTVGRVGGLVLDVAGLAFPQLDNIRRKGKRVLHLDQRKFKYNPQQNTMNWLVNRLQERSTWRGIITALTGLGVLTLGEELRSTVITAGVAVFALVEVLMKDKDSPDAKK